MVEAGDVLGYLASLPAALTVSLDTNIVSYLCDRKIYPIHAILAHQNCIPIVSDVVLNELLRRESNDAIALLTGIRAQQIRYYDTVSGSGAVATYTLNDRASLNLLAEDYEKFLIEW